MNLTGNPVKRSQVDPEIHLLLKLFSVQGPDSRKVLGKLIDGGEEALSNEQFPFYTHKVLEIAGHKVKCD